MLRNYAKRFVFIFLTVVLSLFFLELGVRGLSLRASWNFFRSHKKLTLLSFVVILMIYFLILTLSNNLMISSFFVLVSSLALMISNNQKIKFRNEPVFLYDLENIKNFPDLIRMLSPLMRVISILLLLFLIFLGMHFIKKSREMRFFSKNKKFRFLLMLISFITLISFTKVNKIKMIDNLFRKSGYQEFIWNPLRTTVENGVVPSFLYTFPGSIMDEPVDYSKETMLGIKEKYEKRADKINENRKRENFSDINVVYILSESLASPNNLDELTVNPEPINYIKSSEDKTYYGELLVPIYGGATPNAEYEVLTSLDIHFLNSNMSLPYQNFLPGFDAFPSATSKSSKNHRIIAAHNHHSNFYQRRKNFRTLGFKEVYFKEDMKEIEYFEDKNYVSDYSAYSWILDKLSESEQPIFLHFITMQNHTPYPSGTTSQNEYSVNGLKDSDKETFLAYLHGIQNTDENTRMFIEKLSNLDKDTIVVLYGDHHPPLYTDYLKDDLLGKYTTNYFIYSNLEGHVGKEKTVSAPMLNNLVYELASVKISAYDAFMLEWSEKFIGIVGNKGYTQKGDLVSLEKLPKEYQMVYDEYELIQYDLLNGNNHLGKDFWGLNN